MTAVFGGLDVGSAVGLLLCGPLIHWFGWQSVFYLFAALGLVWCLLWPLCRPEMQDSSEWRAGSAWAAKRAAVPQQDSKMGGCRPTGGGLRALSSPCT